MKLTAVFATMALLCAGEGAFAASSGRIAGNLSLVTTDLNPDDSLLPMVTVVREKITLGTFLYGQDVLVDEDGFAQGPNGEARAEVSGQWQFAVSGRETREGGVLREPSSNFSAQATISSDGFGLLLSPYTSLTLTATFSGEIAIAPRAEEPATAQVVTYIMLRKNEAGSEQSTFFMKELRPVVEWSDDTPTLVPAAFAFSSQSLSVTFSNETGAELPVELYSYFYLRGVSAVPEPGSWRMGLLGLVALAAAVRSRRRQQPD